MRLFFSFFFFLMIRLPPISTLFPYTTPFRSRATPALARRFIFCYLAWQFRRRKMRCRQTRIAWLGIEMRLADGDAVCAAHETRTSNPADSGSQIKYLTASFGFEPQLDFRSHARIEPL